MVPVVAPTGPEDWEFQAKAVKRDVEIGLPSMIVEQTIRGYSAHAPAHGRRWDGRAWNIVPSPNLTEADVSEEFGGYPVSNELLGIAAVSKDDIWAIGRSFTISQGQEPAPEAG